MRLKGDCLIDTPRYVTPAEAGVQVDILLCRHDIARIDGMPFRIYLALFFLFFMNGPLQAGSYLGVREWGNPQSVLNGKAVAMGGGSVAGLGTPTDLALNPAAMSLLPYAALSFSWMCDQTRETTFLADTPVRSHSFNQLPIGELSLSGPFFASGLTAGISYHLWSDFDWEGARDLYASGGLIGAQTFASKGNIRALEPSFAWGSNLGRLGALALGFSFPVYDGKQDADFLRTQNSVNDINLHQHQEFQGVGSHIGFLLAKKTWRVGGNLELPFQMTVDYRQVNSTQSTTTEGTHQWRFPFAYSLGFAIEPGDKWQSLFHLGIRQSFMENFRVDGRPVTEQGLGNLFGDPALRSALGTGVFRSYTNVTELRFGAQHQIYERYAARYGLAFVPAYSQRAVQATLVTLGLGFPIGGRVQADLALEWGFQDFYGDGLFYETAQRVREETRRIVVSLRYD